MLYGQFTWKEVKKERVPKCSRQMFMVHDNIILHLCKKHILIFSKWKMMHTYGNKHQEDI